VFASLVLAGHVEVWPVQSRRFRRWLVGRFFAREGTAPGSEAIRVALNVIEAKAYERAERCPVYVRVAPGPDEASVIIDLGDPHWRVVEITPRGWGIRAMEEVGMKFRRSRGMLPLPDPVPGGSVVLDRLRPLVNLPTDDQWTLFLALVIGMLAPAGPYVITVLTGEQDSAKTTLARLMRGLVDPNTVPLRSPPRTEEDLMVSANKSWCLGFDNVGTLPRWLSNAFCRVSSGGGLGKRELYSDLDEVLIDVCRPIILNGIAHVATAPDLLSRAVQLELPPLAEDARRSEKEFWPYFSALRPELLGCLYDAVSCALRRRPEVVLARMPRMADFAIWVTAAAPALGIKPGAFSAGYQQNRAVGHEAAVEAHPIGPLLRTLAVEGGWSGTPTELYARVVAMVSDTIRRDPDWPKGARALSADLKRLAPSLRALGVVITHERDLDEKRTRRVSIMAEPWAQGAK